MPAKGKSRVTPEQRRKIATGRLAGKTSREIASDTGLCDSTVRKQAADPRTVTLVQRLTARDQERLDKMWVKALKTIEQHLESKDASLAISARRDLLRFMTAGDPPLARLEFSNEPAGDFTLEELLQTYRSFEKNAGS